MIFVFSLLANIELTYTGKVYTNYASLEFRKG